MKVFDIGDELSIDLHAGEAYEVKYELKRTGSHLQIKVWDQFKQCLIIRLACIIFNSIKYKKQFTVIIEEPELNLHPLLQSKLTEFIL